MSGANSTFVSRPVLLFLCGVCLLALLRSDLIIEWKGVAFPMGLAALGSSPYP